MKASDHGVFPHHQRATTMWGRGGKAYDEVSFAISDALAHAAQRLNARAGERILDVATHRNRLVRPQCGARGCSGDGCRHLPGTVGCRHRPFWAYKTAN